MADIQIKKKRDFSFRLMALEFRLRDLLNPPAKTLRNMGLKPGMVVLDFGCGPGGFALAASRIVGPLGRVYALDIHHLALKSVDRAVWKQRINNIHTIHGDCISALVSGSMDIILLFDVLHEISERSATLREIHRLLNPRGVLSVSDHHFQDEFLQDIIVGSGLFRPTGHLERVFQFEPLEAWS
jgi:ubiquinone/menaquinone biosynthesis C-methylase UbiE